MRLDLNVTLGLDCETLHFIILWLMHKDDPQKLQEAATKLKEKSDALKAALDAGQNAGT